MGQTRIEQLDRRTVLKVGGSAIGATVIGGGALIHGSQSATAASNGVNTAATVELDSNQRNVTGVTIAPEIGFDWSDFSNGVGNFQLDVKVSTEPSLSRDAMDTLLDGETLDAGTIHTNWNNQSTKSNVDVVSSSEFSTDSSSNSDVDEVTSADASSFNEASGTGTVNLTEQDLSSSSFSDGLYPQGVDDGEAAGTRVTIDITLEVIGGGESDPSTATVDFNTIEYGVIIDNPSSGASSGDVTMNTGASGE